MKKVLLLIFTIISFSFALNGAKYLIITHDNFYNAILPLAQWKHKKGVPTKVVTLSEIGATPTAISTIKNYIVNAYNTWNPRPEYVLLVGAPNFIYSENNAYDDYYGNMTGDYLMELPVGRFSCTNVSECSLMVTKTLGYERSPYLTDSLWFRKGTTIVREDNDGGTSDSIYWADVRYCAGLMSNAGYIQIDSFSKNRGHSYIDVESAINDGRTYVLFRGQSVGSTWWSPFGVTPSSLVNGFKLPVIISATCYTMSLSGSLYLGERFMRAGSVTNPKGAVGFLGTTQSGSGIAQCRSAVAKGFFRSIFNDKIYKLGDAFKRAKFIADSIYPTNWTTVRYREWNLLGDPELNLWTNKPRQLTVLHDTIIYTGLQTYTVTVKIGTTFLNDALVCLMMNDSVIYQYGYTNSSGTVSFSIDPPTPGTMSVTVTAVNCIPYEKNVTVQLGGNVHDVGILAILEPTGTIGSGTSVYPKVLIKNYGTYTDTFPVTFKIGSVYTQTINQVVLGPGDTVTKQFPVWNATLGTYATKAYTALNNDQWRANDTAFGSFSVVPPIDVGVESIISPLPLHYVLIGSSLIPQAKIKNYGAGNASNFFVICSIVNSNGYLRHTNTQTISLAGGRDTTINFSSWIPTASELCTVKIRTFLGGDVNSNNDRKTGITNIIQIYQVTIGTATTNDRFPFDRFYNYSTHEAIYLKSEININTSAKITHIAYERHSGANTSPIENVNIYMRHTTATTLASGSITLPPTSPYQLVYSGTFPNDEGAGWREVALQTPFYYNNTDNLQILIVKGYQSWINDYPMWRYTATATYQTRRASSDANQPTSLTETYNRPNIALKFSLPYNYDVGVASIPSPSERVVAGTPQNVIAVLKNYGLNSATFSARAIVTDSLSGTIVLLKDSINTLMPDSNRSVDFGQFTPVSNRVYNILVFTALIGDEYNNNDTLKGRTRTTPASDPDGAGYFYESTHNSIYGDTVTYNWFDGSTGVQLTGWSPSADDGNVRVALPFTFPYYGQPLCTVYVNTNGFLQFPTTFTSNQIANQPLPYASINNFIGPLWDDLDLRTLYSPPGRVYQYNDPSNQFVVFQWDSVPRYNQTAQRNTFQIILYKDGRIKYQYKRVSTVAQTSSTVGIQGGNGANNYYLQYNHNGSPSAHIPTSGTAILFNFNKDVGPISIEAPSNVVDSGEVVTPVAVVHNYGPNPANISVKFEINDGYANTQQVTVQGHSSQIVGFAPWTARYFGTFTTKCSTLYADDYNSGNDKITGSVKVRFHDVGAYQIVSPKDTQILGSLPVSAKFKNYYTRTASCSTKFIIRNASGNIVFNQTRYVSNLLPDSIRLVNFGNFSALPGKYYTQTYTMLATDDNTLNDTLKDSVYVVLSAPVLTSPLTSETLNTSTPSFAWQNVTGATAYQIQVADTYNFSSLIVDTIVSNTEYQHLTPLRNGKYYWRVRAGVPYSYWSEVRIFIIRTSVYLIAPLPNAILNTRTPFFDWQDVNNATQYELQIANNVKFSSPIDTIVSISQFQMPSPGLNEGNYFWRVRAGLPYGQWSETRQFTITLSQPGWQRINQPFPSNVVGKGVKDGGAMVAVNSNLYAFRGNKSNEFYMFNGTNWVSKETMPFGKKPQDPTKYNIKRVGKGSALCFDGANKIYATKGNRTQEFWVYNISQNRWTAKAFIPADNGAKGGTSLVFYNGKVYMLLGGRKYGEPNFFVYDTTSNQWSSLNSAPAPDYKPYKDGSCLVLLRDTIFALKGSGKDNYFFAYNIQADVWSQRKTLPLIHPQITQAKKVKDGGAMATDQNVIYAIKGGGAQDFWQYLPGINNWINLNGIPKIDDKSVPKSGASLAYTNGKVYLLKGNNTTEFWQYTPMPTELSQPEPLINTSLMTEKNINISDFTFRVTPNLIDDETKIHFSVQSLTRVQIKLYNNIGQYLETLSDDYYQTGAHSLQVSTTHLSKGIYFIHYKDLTNNKNLIVKIIKK
ncbi:MAG: C25 family cysteine peptidase [candidate division WOR-3 bacterium]|nr:C25 family cysteine peptidase [candidate division WOR-3 bacterium]